MNNEKHTISEWEILKDIIVLDPDGFNRSDPELYKRLFTEAEFEKCLMSSTIQKVRQEA